MQDPVICGKTCRYYVHTQVIDVFIDPLKTHADKNPAKDILAYITVPAGNNGPRKDLAAHLADSSLPIDPAQIAYTTHYLSAPDWDPIVNALKGSTINTPQSRVKLIFVPSYLDGNDGIFNIHYYELLSGMDATVFPSYYYPWGYTPLESSAFSGPPLTTTLAGSGRLAASRQPPA